MASLKVLDCLDACDDEVYYISVKNSEPLENKLLALA